MKVSDIVRCRKPQPGEEDIRFVLREINGDRVLIICSYEIKPLETVAMVEVCLAED
ncbi:hypothetical protein KF840_19420 [bacterium]|nr:hypothetical protein [bacterium]